MKTRSAVRRVLASVVLVVLTSSACTTHAGSAAQVGDETIETSTLRGIVDRGMAATQAAGPAKDPQTGQAAAPIERGDLQRGALTLLVAANLAQQEARQLGVTVTGQDVDSYYQTFGVLQYGSVAAFEKAGAQGGFARDDLRVLIQTDALELAFADRLAPNSVASDADARNFYDQAVARFGPLPLSFGQAKPFLIRKLSTERTAAVEAELRQISQREAILINPRFGVWSASQRAVVAADGSVATTPAPEPLGQTAAMTQ
ncbi:SurA N-terminal domain-containing protein [Frankia sp. Cas3]|uniref:SurA N-terminal domain-containing protein n=1 Tax=Frankia sp. Cas3 TaxID=3073926 RepID=UPI002AD48DD0|nr:SurA N-terminal domain-containing protein [Frankia sp. Cas3]